MRKQGNFPRRSAWHKRRVLNVACGIIVRRNRVLVAQRNHDDYYGGYWEFPGGQMEMGESQEACLVRELQEELGIGVTNIQPWKKVGYAYPDRKVLLHFFLCEASTDHTRPVDCSAVKWLHPSDLKKYLFPPANKSVIHRLTPEFLACYQKGCEVSDSLRSLKK